MASEKDPPLSLEVAADTRESLRAAVEKIKDMRENGPPPIVAATKSTGLLSCKVFAPFDPELTPNINIRAKLLGPQVFLVLDHHCLIAYSIRDHSLNTYIRNRGPRLRYGANHRDI